MRSLLSLLLLLTSFHLRAESSLGSEIAEIKSELAKAELDIKRAEKSIEYLEKEVGQGNKKYVQVLKHKGTIEGELSISRKNLLSQEADLNEKTLKAKKTLGTLLVNAVDKRGRPEEMVANRNLVKIMHLHLKELTAERENNKQILAELNQIEGRYAEYLSVEKELSAMVTDLEEQRKALGNQLLDKRGRYTDLQSALQAKEAKKAKLVKSFPVELPREESRANEKDNVDYSSITLRFESPLDTFTGLENKNKGINFKFNHEGPVTSTQSGKIVYSGDLSTFGNVVMIDHGNETRSVILGQFRPIVKKGDAVNRGDTVGHTVPHKGEGRIYFEVRKKNSVLNTILLMDKEFLAKNNLQNSI